MRALASAIGERAGSSLQFINSVLPRSDYFGERVRALNERYKQTAPDAGATYVDAWADLAGCIGVSQIGSSALRTNLHTACILIAIAIISALRNHALQATWPRAEPSMR